MENERLSDGAIDRALDVANRLIILGVLA